MSAVKGKRDNPFELRAGATDRFYAIFGGTNGFLGETDELATATWSGDGVLLSGEDINTQPLELGGVVYRANTVASVMVAAIRVGDLIDLTCDIQTNTGRIDKQSLWIEGVSHYDHD